MSQVVPLPLPDEVALEPAARTRLSDVVSGIGGFVALGAATALGTGATSAATHTLPAALAVDAGALLLTGPALLVAHQFLGLEARPESLVDALAQGFARAGQLALGLTPAMLYFSASSGLWWLLFPMMMAGIAIVGLTVANRGLARAEGEVQAPDRVLRLAKMHLLIIGWSVLTSLVGLRIAFAVGARIFWEL